MENGIEPRGSIYVYGRWLQFDGSRWNNDLNYRFWIVGGWNESDENAPDEPQPQRTSSEHSQILAAIQERIMHDIQIRMQAPLLAFQPQTPVSIPTPTQVPMQIETPMEVQAPSIAQYAISQVGGEDNYVLDELKEWQKYVDTAFEENPTSPEVLWQLQSSKTVLKSITENLADLIERDEDDHDFDIAKSGQDIEAIIDTTRKKHSFRIENVATHPRNLYTLRGQRSQEKRGAGLALIKHIVGLAVEKGDDVVRLVALTPQHVLKYKKMGFALDKTRLEADDLGQLIIPSTEIPMKAKVEVLRSRFNL